MMKLITKLTIGFFLLAAVLLLEYFTDWDTDLQEYFFDRPHNRWLIYPELHKKLSVFFYKGIKTLLAVTALCCLARLALSIRQKQLRPDNKPYWIMLLSIIFVPALIAGAKYVTNVYCPYQLNIYNGLYPFVRILESYPADFIQPKPGRCFPAGHATAGFAGGKGTGDRGNAGSDWLSDWLSAGRPPSIKCTAGNTFSPIRYSA